MERTDSSGGGGGAALRSITDVHAAWLAAGAAGDVETMRHLLDAHPVWFNLQRVRQLVVERAAYCTASSAGWERFRLSTLGASTLHAALWEGHLDVETLLLERGLSADTSDNDGVTPLMVAIMRFNVVATRRVFRGALVVRHNVVVDCRETETRQLEMLLTTMKLLLRFGADVDARRSDGKSALHCATNDEALQVAKRLLDAGADIDAQDEKGKAPLHLCVEEGGLLVTNLLLSRGACILQEDGDGVTPLALAIRSQNTNAIQLFVNHYHRSVTPKRLDFAASVLLEAVAVGADHIVRFVVESAYASVTTCNAAGETPLHLAIVRREPSLVHLVASLDVAGANLTATTRSGESAAHYAARFGSHQEVATLLQFMTRTFGDLQVSDEAANPLNATDDQGATSLYVAGTCHTPSALVERDDKAQLLLEHGAKLFPARFLMQQCASARTWTVPRSVQQCLVLWILEQRLGEAQQEIQADEEDVSVVDDARVTQLCLTWTSCVVQQQSSALVGLLPVVVGAGYAREVVPLLLVLPLIRDTLPRLLHGLEIFAGRPRRHALLLELHWELINGFGRMD